MGAVIYCNIIYLSQDRIAWSFFLSFFLNYICIYGTESVFGIILMLKNEAVIIRSCCMVKLIWISRLDLALYRTYCH